MVSRFHHNTNGENDGRKKRGNQHEAAARRDASRLCVDYKCSNRARGKRGRVMVKDIELANAMIDRMATLSNLVEKEQSRISS